MKRLTLDQQFTYLVAVSYGPDSMALLSMLVKQGYSVHVAHINYHRRPESNLEQTGIEQYCFTHDIPCSILDVSQPLPKGNFQAEARALRYRFFKQVMDENHLDVLLTGHHEDDHLETAMFHEQRQSWVPYYGIQYETTLFDMRVIRPLLIFSKQALLEYCDHHLIPYAIDASNANSLYTRNRIRKEIARWSKDRRHHELVRIEFKNKEQLKAIQSYQKLYSEYLPLSVFQEDISQLYLILYAYFNHHHVLVSLTKTWLTQLKKIAASPKPNWMKVIQDGLFIKHYDRFEWIRLPSSHSYHVKYEGKTIFHPWFEIHNEAKDIPSWLTRGVRIRNAKNGDQWFHANQHLRLNRLFGDWKMPMYLRKYWPVFVNAQGKIIYTPRYQRNVIQKPLAWLIVRTKRK
jgi:tRNA(Ile)-lysidine synthase